MSSKNKPPVKRRESQALVFTYIDRDKGKGHERLITVAHKLPKGREREFAKDFATTALGVRGDIGGMLKSLAKTMPRMTPYLDQKDRPCPQATIYDPQEGQLYYDFGHNALTINVPKYPGEHFSPQEHEDDNFSKKVTAVPQGLLKMQKNFTHKGESLGFADNVPFAEGKDYRFDIRPVAPRHRR
jgi:hypothetical protein